MTTTPPKRRECIDCGQYTAVYNPVENRWVCPCGWSDKKLGQS